MDTEQEIKRICAACNQALGLDSFGKNKARKDGLSATCKECVRKKNKEQYDKHAEKRRQYSKEYAQNHKEERSEYAKKYHKENKEHINRYSREWRKNNHDYQVPDPEARRKKNTERMKAKYANDPEYRALTQARKKEWREKHKDEKRETHKKYRSSNIEHCRKYARDYYRNKRATDPEYKARAKLIHTVSRHKRHGAHGETPYIRDVENREISKETIIRLHAWQRNRCYMCNRKIENDSTVEHIIPRAKGGPSIEQNIVLTCPSCNYSRQSKIWFDEWEPEQIFDIPADEAYISPSNIIRKLAEHGIEAVQDGNGVLLNGKKEKKLFVLSSFVATERSQITRLSILPVTLRKTEPDAIILIDHEWYGRFPNVINMLKAKLGIAERTYARKLTAEYTLAPEAREFMDAHHVMGFGVGTHYIVLRDDTGFVCGCGIFKALPNGEYDNVRLAFHGHVPGGMSKIIKFLRQEIGNAPITSYVDSRYADGSGHESIGFEHRGMTPVGYRWVFPDRTQHYRYLSNQNKIVRNLLYIMPDRSVTENIAANGVFKMLNPPLHRIALVVPD